MGGLLGGAKGMLPSPPLLKIIRGAWTPSAPASTPLPTHMIQLLKSVSYIYFSAIIHKIPTRVFQCGCGCGLHILPSLVSVQAHERFGNKLYYLPDLAVFISKTVISKAITVLS